MNHAEAVSVLLELDRRTRVRDFAKHALRNAAFPAQRSLLDDERRLKAALCTRRAGKSYGCGLGLFEAALDAPGSSSLYVGLTRETAKRIMVKDVLARIDAQHKIGAKAHKTELSYTLPNGSVIYLVGADASEAEMAKVLGQKYRRVIVDEAQSYRIDLRTLVYKHLRPATADMLGDIWLCGTPDDAQTGLFFDITRPDVERREPGWTLHQWSASDNPHIAKQWALELADLAATRPLFLETPEFQQHYLGRWAINETALCYRHSASRNNVATAPDGISSAVLGVDLGFEDATAFVVAGYRDHDKSLYLLESQKHSKLTLSQVADFIKGFQARHPIHKVVVDGAAKQSVEEMRQRHGLQLEAAEKTDKFAFIHMMNSDLIEGLVKVVEHGNPGLLAEWSTLVWDKKDGEKLPREDPRCENHLADAALYAWRFARNFYAGPRDAPAPHPNSEEALEVELAREEAEMKREQAVSFWELE